MHAAAEAAEVTGVERDGQCGRRVVAVQRPVVRLAVGRRQRGPDLAVRAELGVLESLLVQRGDAVAELRFELVLREPAGTGERGLLLCRIDRDVVEALPGHAGSDEVLGGRLALDDGVAVEPDLLLDVLRGLTSAATSSAGGRDDGGDHEAGDRRVNSLRLHGVRRLHVVGTGWTVRRHD